MLLNKSGFSLIEVLISLFVVSLTGLNLTALQQRILTQQRDNLAHAEAISLATKRMESVLSMTNVDDLVALDEVAEKEIQLGNTEFTIEWNVNEVDSEFNAGEDFREIKMGISWVNTKGNTLSFTYSEQVSLTLLLSGSSDREKIDQLAGIIISDLSLNDVIYFEPTMGYKKGAFVIHDSYLYRATSAYSVGNGQPRSVSDPITGNESGINGWQSYGRIDNPELAGDIELSSLFSENIN